MQTVQASSELLSALNYIAIGLISIFYGFFATGRDGLMYDLRLVRGLHRIRWNITFYTFTCYSILLALSQWSIDSDCSEIVHLKNQTNTDIILSNTCNGFIISSMWLWIVILFLDAIYIITLLSHRDYRSERLMKERIKIRKIQRTQMGVSLIILCIRIVILLVRFGIMIFAIPLSAATFLNVVIIVFLFCNLYAHGRAMSIYAHHIRDLESKNIEDTGENKLKMSTPRHILESSDEEDEESAEESTDRNTLLQKKLTSKRPIVKIVK